MDTTTYCTDLADVCNHYGLSSRFIWHDREHEICEIGGQWCRRGRWWAGEPNRRFFRAITRTGLVLDLCVNETTGEWRVARAHD
ncbi:MAG: hypothetical protein R6V19_02710 [Armatimonadota bacterium]